MSFIDKKLQQIAEQTQEQQKAKNSFIDQKLQQIAEQTRLQNQATLPTLPQEIEQNHYEEKAQDILDELKQTSKILPQGQQEPPTNKITQPQQKQALPTNEITSQGQQEPKEFDLAEQNTLSNNYTNIYQQMQDEKKKEAISSHMVDRAYRNYRSKEEYVIDDFSDYLPQKREKPLMSYEEYKELYEKSFDDNVFFGANDEQTQRYMKNNNLNNGFIKLYNSYARDSHFENLLNPHEFKHKYTKELLKNTVSNATKHKAQLEYHHTYYSDMVKQIKTAMDMGSEQDIEYLKSVQKSINNDLALYFKNSLGLSLAVDENGSYYAKDPLSGITFKLDDKLDNFWESFRTSNVEFAGAIIGAIYGAKAGALLTGGNPFGAAGGALIGGAGGAYIGAMADDMWNLVALGHDINSHLEHIHRKGKEAALFDVVSTAGVSVAFKVTSKTIPTLTPNFIKEPIKKGVNAVKRHIAEEGITTAERYINRQFNENELDELLSLHQKYQTLDLDAEFIKEIKQAKTDKGEMGILEKVLDTFTDKSEQSAIRQKIILVYALARDDGMKILEEAVTTYPHLKKPLIQTINNLNTPLAKMLDETNFSIDNLINVSRAVQKEVKQSYSDYMSVVDALSKSFNVNYDTKIFFDDMENILHSSYFDKEEKKLFKTFIDNKIEPLKDKNGNIKPTISLHELNEFKIGLTNIYKDARESGVKGFEAWHRIKEATDEHISTYLNQIQNNLPKDIKHNLNDMYKENRRNYAIMKTTIDNDYFKSTQQAVEKININYDNIINELSTNQKNYQEFSNGVKVNRLALYTSLMNEQQKAEFELGFINAIINKTRLHTNDNRAVILFDKNKIAKVLENAEFQTQAGKDFKQTFLELQRLFNNDEKIIKILSTANQPEPSQGISPIAFVRLATMLANRGMEVVKRYLPFLGQASVRHHIRKALEKSNNLIDFQKQIKFYLDELDKTPLLSSITLKDFANEINGLVDLQTAFKNGTFAETKINPIKEVDYALMQKANNEHFIINSEKDMIERIEAPKVKIDNIHENAPSELSGQIVSDDKIDKFLKDFLELSSKEIKEELQFLKEETIKTAKQATKQLGKIALDNTKKVLKDNKLRIFGKFVSVYARNGISHRGDTTYDVFVENNNKQKQTAILKNVSIEQITSQNIKNALKQHIKEKSYTLDYNKPIRVFKDLNSNENIEKADIFLKSKLLQIPQPKQQKSKEWWMIDLHGVDISVIKYNDLSFDVFAMINGEKIKLLNRVKKDSINIRYLRDLIEYK